MNVFIGVMVGLVVLFFIIYFTAQIIVGDPYSKSAKQDPILQKQIAEAVKPVGSVSVAPVKKATAAPAEQTQDAVPAKQAAAVTQVPIAAVQASAETDAPVAGKEVYASACFACHGTGAAGAPKLGDKAAWAARIAQGMDTLNDHAIKGFNAMPPKGGRLDLDDATVKAVVEYMVAESK